MASAVHAIKNRISLSTAAKVSRSPIYAADKVRNRKTIRNLTKSHLGSHQKGTELSKYSLGSEHIRNLCNQPHSKIPEGTYAPSAAHYETLQEASIIHHSLN